MDTHSAHPDSFTDVLPSHATRRADISSLERFSDLSACATTHDTHVYRACMARIGSSVALSGKFSATYVVTPHAGFFFSPAESVGLPLCVLAAPPSMLGAFIENANEGSSPVML